MSHSRQNEPLDALRALIHSLHDERITPEDKARLEEWVCRDKEARRVYVEYMYLYAWLQWDHRKQAPTLASPGAPAAAPSPVTPVVEFLGDAFRAGVDFLSRSFVLTLLLAIGLPAILLLVLIVDLARQPVARAPEPPAPVAVARIAVAKISDSLGCVWAKQPARAELFAGQQLQLNEGLAEVAFADGAKVILQGPAVFRIVGAGVGRLDDGSLAATVPPPARGFTIDTPHAKVVDLGTEFGVLVEKGKDAAEVQVFQGEVELAMAAAEDNKASSHRLKAGRAVRIELAAEGRTTVLREIAPAADRFVRQLRAPAAKPDRMIAADFSGGNGQSEPDQFPGAPGPGWATPWSIAKVDGIDITAVVDGAEPVNAGGKCLRVEAVRQAGKTSGSGALVRCLQSTPEVDLARPYVISFDVRVERLEQFTLLQDSIGITGNSEPGFDPKSRNEMGWTIRVVGTDAYGVPARHWRFNDGDGKGGSTCVDTGISVSEGSVYSFRVVVDPQARTWTPSVSVDGGEFHTFKAMGMRGAGTAEQCHFWAHLNFDSWVQSGKNREGADRIRFSVDSIQVRQADREDNEGNKD